MKFTIAKEDWDTIHEIVCDIANASGAGDEILSAMKTENLFSALRSLEAKYGRLSRIIATYADYTENKDSKKALLNEAFESAQREGDLVNAGLIWESLTQLDLE